jgi:hypothetical protein
VTVGRRIPEWLRFHRGHSGLGRGLLPPAVQCYVPPERRRKMVETTLDIGFYGDDEARVIVDSNAPDHVQEPAELVAFGHYAVRIINRLGPDRARPLISGLRALEKASIDELVTLVEREGPSVGQRHIRVSGPERTARAEETFLALARFLDPRRGPRMSFTLKARGNQHASASVPVLLHALLKRRAGDRGYLRRLADTGGCIGRFAASGRMRPDNEFDLALAAADVAWGNGRELLDRVDAAATVRCPTCGSELLDPMLWPSERSEIRGCSGCGAGVWLRTGRSPHLIARDVWDAMAAIRSELARSSDDGAAPTLEWLKSGFAENGWPYSEVGGANVLVSDLSGPLGTWRFYAQVVEEQGLLLLYSICPVRAPEERRAEVAHFLTRVNYGLSAATFELDFDDGEVRCKTVLQLDPEPDAAALKRSVRANGLAMETYLPAIETMIAGDRS